MQNYIIFWETAKTFAIFKDLKVAGVVVFFKFPLIDLSGPWKKKKEDPKEREWTTLYSMQ